LNPKKVDRNKVRVLTDLPNVGAATAGDLKLLGINEPSQLRGKSALSLHEQLCKITGVRHDPCMIDVFESIVHFVDGGEALPWWHFTPKRKARA
jgi:hypothetical protein